MDEESKDKFDAIEKELSNLRKLLTAGGSPRAIRISTYIPQERLDELERQLERQNSLIEVLRETVPHFGRKFDKLCTDKEMHSLNPSVPDVAAAVFGEEDQ